MRVCATLVIARVSAVDLSSPVSQLVIAIGTILLVDVPDCSTITTVAYNFTMAPNGRYCVG